jgi:hypothetical protein
VDNYLLLKFTFIIIKFFHGILEVEKLEISIPNENICPEIPINFYFKWYACTKHFSENWQISRLFFRLSSEIIFPEVKHRPKILIDQLPVILEQNIQKNIQLFFQNRIKILNNVSERNNYTIPFFAILGMVEPLLWLCAHKG